MIKLRKKMSVTCLSAVLCAIAVLSAAAPVKAEESSSYPPGMNSTREWKITHDEDGNYINHIPYDTADEFLVMPGERLLFDPFFSEKESQIAGTEVSTVAIIELPGMDIIDDCSAVSKKVSFSKSGAKTRTVVTEDYQDPTKNKTDTLQTCYTVFENKTEYAAYVSYKGDLATATGYTKDAQGHMTKTEICKVVGYTAKWYPIKWNLAMDITTGGQVADATFQGMEKKNEAFTTWYGGNNAYTYEIQNPVSAGRHFTCWTTEIQNIGFNNPSEAIKATDYGMSTTMISYTPGKYAPSVSENDAITLTANWIDDYTVTFHAGTQGTVFGQADYIYELREKDGVYAIPAGALTTESDAYECKGWSYKDGEEEKYIAFTPDKTLNLTQIKSSAEGYNLDLTAVWQKKTLATAPPGNEGGDDKAQQVDPSKVQPGNSDGSSDNKVAKPGKVTIKKVKSPAKKKIKVTWKALKADGYEIMYSANKKFKKGNKTKLTKKTSVTLKNVKKKTCYVRVRAYNVDVNGKKVYGKWSKRKKVTVKI